MRIISGGEIDAVLTHRDLVETLRRAYRSSAQAPAPSAFEIGRPGSSNGLLRILPAWSDFEAQGHTDRGYIGCHLALDLNLAADDSAGFPASGIYVLYSGKSGQPVALLDGKRLSLWRKAAVHALALSYLGREDCERLLVLGHHPALHWFIAAYSSVRPIRSVLIAGPSSASADSRRALSDAGHTMTIGHTDDAATAAEGADLVLAATCADLASVAAHLPAGVHVDLIGEDGQLPDAAAETCRLFTADRGSDPLAHKQEVAADLSEITQGEKAGRRYYAQQTLFTAGPATGLADLAAAGHVFLRS